MNTRGLRLPFPILLQDLLLISAMIAGSAKVHAQTTNIYDTETKLIAPDATTNAFFGFPVSIDGNTAAMGSLDFGAGSVYVYARIGTNWVFTQKLTAPITNAFETFGEAIDLENDVMVVGQQNTFIDLNISGQVYIFRRIGGTWVLEQALFETNSSPDRLLGAAVGVSGQTVVAGNFQDSSVLVGAGSINVYQRTGTNWVLQAILQANDPSVNAHLGGTIAIDGNTVISGAVGAEVLGAAYIFVRSGTTWVQQQKLQPADLTLGAGFGGSVAIEGNIVVVGAPGQTVNGVLSGAVYVFERVGTIWTLRQRIVPATTENSYRFGTSVSLFNGLLIIGTPGENLNQGSAFVYRFDGTSWVLAQKLIASDAAVGVGFGHYVDITAGAAIVSALFDNEAANDAGAAYIYSQSQAVTNFTATASPRRLFPANHKLVPVTITVSANGLFTSCRIISVSSNEPSNAKGNGKREPDWIITGDLTLLLRAERTGQAKQGRVYTIVVECRDGQGIALRRNVIVTVPHDARTK